MQRFRFVLLMVPLAACYRYEPLASPTPAIGLEVRSHLTPEGSQQLSTTLGRGIASVDSRLVAEESNVWRIAVTRTRTAEAREVSWSGEMLAIPKDAVNRWELKVLDRKKTIRAAVLGAAGGIAVGLLIKGIAGAASGDPNGGGGNPITLIPR